MALFVALKQQGWFDLWVPNPFSEFQTLSCPNISLIQQGKSLAMAWLKPLGQAQAYSDTLWQPTVQK